MPKIQAPGFSPACSDSVGATVGTVAFPSSTSLPWCVAAVTTQHKRRPPVALVVVGIRVRRINGRCTGDPAVQYRPVSAASETTYPRGISGHRMETFQYDPGVWAGADVWWGRIAGHRLEMGGSTSWLVHPDAVGSMVMETDQTGAVTWDVTHYPWGQPWQRSGTRGSELFAGLEWPVNDPAIPSATREYNPYYYRWQTPDPGGRKVVNLANPQTWNMYAYVTDNPTTLNDPSGMAAKGCGKESHNVCPKQPLNGVLKAGRQDQLQRALQAYYHAQRVKEQQAAQKQAGPAFGSKEYLKQITDKVYKSTESLQSPLFPATWYGTSGWRRGGFCLCDQRS